MENIVLWGAGKVAKKIVNGRSFFENKIHIIGIIDSDEKKWGNKLENYVIMSPDNIWKIVYDKIIVSTGLYFNEVKRQLICQYSINPKLIENSYYFAKKKLMMRYINSEDSDIKSIYYYLQKNSLNIFNYPFIKKYEDMNAEILYDVNAELYYVMHKGKRLYMKKSLDTMEKIKKYYCNICREQDKESPHLYLDSGFQVENGDIVVDIGAAEGYFSLEVIEKASKIYLIETDEKWIEALKYTFFLYKDKIVILNRFVSDYTADDVTTLDNVIKEKVNFIKMDIEGSEIEALKGAKNTIEYASRIRCAICAYHNDNDEIIIKRIAENYGMKCSYSRGYMYYPEGEKQCFLSPILRRGIVRCEKNNY